MKTARRILDLEGIRVMVKETDAERDERISKKAAKATITFKDGEILEKTFYPRSVPDVGGGTYWYSGYLDLKNEISDGDNLMQFGRKFRRAIDIAKVDYEEYIPEWKVIDDHEA